VRVSPFGLLLGGLVAALLLATVLLVGPATDDLPELSVYSNAPAGGRALRLWLEALGYPVTELDEDPYAVPEGTAALFVLQPSSGFDREAVESLTGWVGEGGQLVVAASGRGARRLLDAFGLSLEFTGERQEEAEVVQPLLAAPPVRRVRVDAWDALAGTEELAPWVAAKSHVYAGSRPYGKGRVIVFSATYPFSNAGLGSPDNAGVVLNLLTQLPPGARLAFDEYHHGIVRRGTRGLWSLLLENPWGWAALYGVVLAYLYLVWAGRRFGRPLAPLGAPRRTVGEYVASLAALYRRAGQRAYAADRLADQLKQQVTTALGLSPRLTDAAFVEAVGERRPVDRASLARVLARLRYDGRLREGELLKAAGEADELARVLVRRTR
jgi:hypothetical protein